LGHPGGGEPFFRGRHHGTHEEAVNNIGRIRLFIRRFLGEDVSGADFDGLMDKYEEARVMREFEAGVVQEAAVRAFRKER
jgi:hypothetical protein